MTSPAPYTNGFVSIFIRELQTEGQPTYPHLRWFMALRKADLALGVEAIRRTVKVCQGRTLYCYEYDRRVVLPPADRSPEMYELDRRCSAFLLSRGLQPQSSWAP